MILHKIRIWDARTAHGPDAMIANSEFVARRIKKIYGRDAKTIYPPVTLSNENSEIPRGPHFLAASRLVPYKKVESIVLAFRELPELQLVVAGSGPEAEHLKKVAGPNVSFVGFVSDQKLRHLMATARAFVFAAEEDFGIIIAEALSEGTPVLALGRGGAREIVSTSPSRRTGMFFDTPEPRAIADCVRDFVAQENSFLRSACRAQASQFSAKRFRSEFTSFVEDAVSSLIKPQSADPQPTRIVA
jgi:glycosyltransferase involved in cell wall biosynthesis